MTENYQVVPWFNSEEWHKVYNDLSSTSIDKKESLRLLLIWKARSPSLPSGIESTLSLLQVFLEDVSEKRIDAANDQLLRLAYSSAIMRFVNHMLDTETAKGTSLYQAAKNLGVPDWIVDLRHDTAHSNNLPSITLLREACLISLQWLREHYWDKHKEYIQDYLADKRETRTIDGNRATVLLNFCMSLSICAHSNCKIKNLSEITDAGMKKSIVADAQELFRNKVNLTNLKQVSVNSLINLTNEKFSKVLKGRDVVAYMNEVLLGDDSLFFSKELLRHFGHKNLRNINKFKNNYVQCFEVLLTILHTNELLGDFIMCLIRITQSSESTHLKSQLAALWVSEILVALNKSNLFIQKLKKMNSEAIKSKVKDEQKQLYYHWFPSDTTQKLMLDLVKPVPAELTDINFIQPIIAVYNPYLNIFVKNLLSVVEPALPTAIADKICKLAEVISMPKKFPVSNTSKIYTAFDLKSVQCSDDESVEIVNETMDAESAEVPQVNINSGVWRLVSTDHDWSSCPIGQVPWHQNVDGAVVMEE